MRFTPYPICKGRKIFALSRNKKLRKLIRPLAIFFKTKMCDSNKYFTQKYKISFLQQLFRLFYRDSLGFRVVGFFKKGTKCELIDGDYINLICHAGKSIIKKLLSRIAYELYDYKILKRRKYTLIFTFNICNRKIEDSIKNITLDIECNQNDMFKFFITLNTFYSVDLIQMLFYHYIDNGYAIK
jgi:hypothetical protein